MRIFALSRVYYVASVLPIKSSMVKKFESIMGKFIWHGSGRILRVALEELKNDHLSGGLNLPCLGTMSKSLMSSQVLRLLRSGDSKSVAHVDYWMGSLLADLVPGMGLGEEAAVTPEYFSSIGDYLAELMISEVLTVSTLPTLTNKLIYKELASFPTPKVASDATVDYKVIWRRSRSPYIGPEARDVMFLLLHNKLPVIERLFRIGVNPSILFSLSWS